jgi:Tol biopolymer transport system component
MVSDARKSRTSARSDGDRTSNIFVVNQRGGAGVFETVDVSGGQLLDGSSIVYTLRPTATVRIVPVTGGEGSRLVGGHGSDASNAVLSPDGSVLSYSCDTHGGSEYDLDADLCVANADGSDPRVIVPGGGSFGILTASWSPEGSRLAYWTFHKWDVYILDVATGQRTLVGKGAWPSWLDDDTLNVEIYYGPA